MLPNARVINRRRRWTQWIIDINAMFADAVHDCVCRPARSCRPLPSLVLKVPRSRRDSRSQWMSSVRQAGPPVPDDLQPCDPTRRWRDGVEGTAGVTASMTRTQSARSNAAKRSPGYSRPSLPRLLRPAVPPATARLEEFSARTDPSSELSSSQSRELTDTGNRDASLNFCTCGEAPVVTRPLRPF